MVLTLVARRHQFFDESRAEDLRESIGSLDIVLWFRMSASATTPGTMADRAAARAGDGPRHFFTRGRHGSRYGADA